MDNWNDNYVLLIADQGYKTEEKTKFYESLPNTHYWYLPFDSGLPAGRNFLIQKAKEKNIDYCIVTADSIQFTDKYNFEPIIKFMETDNKIIKVGFDLQNRINWEFKLDLISNKSFILNISNDYTEFEGINFQKVDICRNYCLIRTNLMLQVPGDKKLKIGEHTDSCWRIKRAGLETYYTPTIKAKYIDDKPQEYLEYRQRIHNTFRQIMLEKYQIKSWIKYGKNVTFSKS